MAAPRWRALPRAWLRRIVDDKGQIDRRAYTVCALERLQDGLQRRDVFVRGSQRWGDPRVKLLHGARWDALRSQVCRALGHQETADHARPLLTAQLDTAYRQTLAHLPSNAAVRVQGPPGREELIVSESGQAGRAPESPRPARARLVTVTACGLARGLAGSACLDGFCARVCPHHCRERPCQRFRWSVSVRDSWPKPAILAWNRSSARTIRP